MSDKVFTEGLFIKAVNTQYGDIIKISVDVEKFKEFMETCEHVNVSEKNGKSYLNIDVSAGKSGKWYAAVDTWKSESNDTPY